MRLGDLAGKHVVIWGYGREGRAAANALAPIRTASVTIVDDAGVDGAHSGGAGDAAIAAADVVIKSPGISRYDPRAHAVTARGAVLTGGTALWMSDYAAVTIAVTGSKGKSTTSALIHHLASAIGIENTYGGNIGTPLLSLPTAQNYVVELSSYQCAELDTSPWMAVLTSLFPEHLNWHGSAERYFHDKLNLIAHGPEFVLYNAADSRLVAAVDLAILDGRLDADAAHGINAADGWVRVADVEATPWFFVGTAPVAPVSALPLRGAHNVNNACLALAALDLLADDHGESLTSHTAEVGAGLRSFEALPHRLGVTTEEDTGLQFVDDSLSTAPQAAIAALEAFPDGPVAIIVGGQDRGVDYTPLRDYLAEAARPILVIGIPQSGPRIVEALTSLDTIESAVATDLIEAVRVARGALPDGGTVLLSPAAPSYGLYRNFEERAAAFAEARLRTRNPR